jgi:hypothetical protein
MFSSFLPCSLFQTYIPHSLRAFTVDILHDYVD